ncbi:MULTISPECIES: SDR family NAD(P)-dependent oxidoreductase [Pseudofrankia]|uniref:SDR family NAD(P)-dependent oxidoreductase n=1 Tax=Pseudofrankia TaxID=2994363 RepID=UPI000234B62D|nr:MULTISPECIES: SDR family oxidoreductase [Pseudofrankia]
MPHPQLPPVVDPKEFAGRVVLVTAAAGGGIGEATARRFAAAGATVVVTDAHRGRTEAVAARLAREHRHATVVGHQLDVGSRAAIDIVVETVLADHGAVDVLVNNAAFNRMGGHFDYDPADWDRAVEINLSGPWYLCRRLLPAMRDRRRGVVVNVSSYAPDVGGNGLESPYAITKGGLNVLTRSVAHEGGPFGIRAVTVAMGVVGGTRFIDQHPEIIEDPGNRGPLPWMPTAGDIAETIAFLASDRARCVTGESVNVASGAYMRT